MNKKLLTLLLVPFLLIGCTGDTTPSTPSGDDPSGGGEGGGGSGGGGGEGGGGDVDPDKGNQYDYWCNSWSKPGHLYFHYNRGNKGGYDDYALWLWPYYPDSLEGTLWAYNGETRISDTLTLRPMSDHWMTNAEVGKEGNDRYLDEYGVIADVDYTSTSLLGGKTGKPVSFADSIEIGFLLPQISHMDGSTMWVSDGGKETYVTDIMEEDNWREIKNAYGTGKAIHIFVSSGQLDKHSYYVGDGTPEVKVNPIDNDTTGEYRSEIVNYSSSYGLSSTSEAFKQYGVGYQVFVASFRDSNNDGIGDIRGIIDSLDYLQNDVGAEVLWLTPIQKSDSYHGYDISDYYAVDKRYGTIEDYRELIYKAHQRGMTVLMDLVLNHTSKNNVWFTKSQWGEKSKGPNGEDIDWRNVYTWKFESDTIEKYQNGNYVTMTVKEDAESPNPSWYRDGESHYYYYGKFGSGMPEINYQNEQTRNLVIDMAKYWMSFGLDGFRLDAVKHIFMRDEAFTSGDQVITDVGQKRAYDEEKGQYITKDFDYSSNLTKNIMWWKEFAVEVKNEYPNCFLVGENFDGWGTRTAPYYQALDSQFDFASYYHIASMIYGAGGASAWQYTHPKETYDVFGSSDYFPLGDSGVTVQGGCRPDFIDGAFTSNHDVMRAINQVNGSPTGAPGETAASTHITGAGDEVNKDKIHAAITMFNQGISWIYYGDELGMSSNTYKHIEMYGSENNEDIWYRQPFLWQDTTIRPHYKHGQYVFELDDYNKTLPTMEEQKQDANSMLSWYKALAQIKKLYPANATVTYSPNSGTNVLVIKVTGNGKTMGIWINTGLNTNDYSVNPSDVLGTDQYNVVGQLGPQPVDGYNIGGAKFSVLALQAK